MTSASAPVEEACEDRNRQINSGYDDRLYRQRVDLLRSNILPERKLNESRTTEEKMKEELTRAFERVKVAEEAEKMLRSQLEDLEAEATDQVRDYEAQILALMEELSLAQRLLQAHSLHI